MASTSSEKLSAVEARRLTDLAKTSGGAARVTAPRASSKGTPTCNACDVEIAPGETVVYRRAPSMGMFGRGWRIERRCMAHWTRQDQSDASFLEHLAELHSPGWAKPAQPCAGGCGRMVAWLRYYDPPHWYCSEGCWPVAEVERDERRLCAVCDDYFSARRADARYCSNACRQDAYRKRRTGFLRDNCATVDTPAERIPAASGG